MNDKTPPPANTEQNAAASGRSGVIRVALLVAGIVLLGAAFALILYGDQLFNAADPQASQEQQLESLTIGTPRTVAPPINIAPAPEPGDAAPPFLLQDMAGEEVTLAQFRGQPVIINFWATWCAPCIFEMPELQTAFETHGESGLMILALNRDEAPEKVGDFLANDLSVELTFPILLDEHAVIADSYGILNMPTTYFVDSDGIVAAVHRGPLTLEQIETYLGDLS